MSDSIVTTEKNSGYQVQVFKNDEFGEVRTLAIDNEPWFVGRDVAEILGYSNTRDALTKRVDDEDKMKGVAICDPIGREQKPVLINESGLYSLILTSKLPTVKKFKRWVTSEVLPSIRKHGAYMTAPTIDAILADPDYGIKLLTELKEERAQRKMLADTVVKQDMLITEMKPKANYYDVILNSPDLINITAIAQDYGWSGKQLNDFLRNKGVQYKQKNGLWHLYKKYADEGYTSTKTNIYDGRNGVKHASLHMTWTQKGRLFIYNLLKENGILPVMERPCAEQLIIA